MQEIRGTFFVTLPKQWVERLGISKGREISINERQDGSLIVTVDSSDQQKEELSAVIDYPTKKQITVREMIISLYLSGYNALTVRSTQGDIPGSERENLLALVKKLAGMEVLEEDTHNMVIRCILDPFAMKPRLILRRMGFLVCDMIKGLCNPEDQTNLGSVIKMDDEVDRAYFLLVRLLRSAVSRPQLSKDFELDPVNYLDYRVAAGIVESIGDRVSDTAEDCCSSHELTNDIRSLSRDLSEYAAEALKCSLETFLANDYSRIRSTRDLIARINGIAEGKLKHDGSPSTGYGHASSILSYISESCRNILDLMSYEKLIQHQSL